MSTAEGQKCYSILSSAKAAKEWYERVQRMRQISCVVLALKKAGFYLCGVLFFYIFKTYIQLSVNYRPSLQFFSVDVFPSLFSA